MTAHIVNAITGQPAQTALALNASGHDGDLATRNSSQTAPAGQLWEREADRETSYYYENGYRYTNQLTLTRSILIGIRLSRQALGITEEGPANLSRHMLDQGYKRSVLWGLTTIDDE